MIPGKWIYKVKQTVDGKVDKYKARFVAKGYAQTYGVDYEETYLPVFKLTLLRILLSIGVILDLEIHQMDVKTAFLNGDIDTEVYIEQLKGFGMGEDLVCKLKKSLYGLKQSPHLWNKKINMYLKGIGFTSCVSDPCIYHKKYVNNVAFIGIWVDDIVIAASKKEMGESRKH